MKRSIVSAVSLLLLSSLVTAQAVAQDQTEPTTEPGPVDADAETAPTPPSPPAAPSPPAPLPTPTATAPAAKPAAPAEKREVISVTGSRIKRTDMEGPAPVQIIPPVSGKLSLIQD